MEKKGEMPLPPYIKKKLEHPETYQTIYVSKKGAIAFVGATQYTWHTTGDLRTGNSANTYHFFEYLITKGCRCGDALYQSKEWCYDNHKSRYDNTLAFNLCGDPSLGLIINHPPNKPAKPSGPTEGKVGKDYIYTTSAIDPDGDKVKYGWDWNGDLVVDEWTNLYESGETMESTHAWDEKGNYSIRVKAKDESGLESPWSDSLVVSMPKIYDNSLSLWLQKLNEWLSKIFGRELFPGIFNL
ncbi:MAG: C25 family cysteine peptidase [Candidatus Thermoplasmatota archaeon]|nr:C25 family cysteine peptidase [Candidatus Thermoplasmatota archaeon]